ncbi:glutathione S-transferase [Jannaschia pagri]|uniref:Glutathione S-transferase n=1 Tax=Jannaschia pagri TaxID=2829797 RepID=A0ABQ4NQ03_9RHOB|nr:MULTISPECIES: glutathione S-transferase [unclassified Jannaschia]GIT92652.1 glutathione S-transferase [Jannaschia sp. AI_61]GIT96488.1 glutathione S-transferase [Jannaschia sp. AI_62]
MYTLHGRVKSRALRTLWMLEELGLPYSYHATEPRSPEAFAVSPLGKVPVLLTEDGPVYDSVAQMTMLADREGRFTHPAGSHARGVQDGFTNSVTELLDVILWEMAKHVFVLPADQRVAAIKDSLRWQWERNAGLVAELLGGGPYATGAEPTVPDVLLAHCCGWAAGLKLDLPSPLRTHMTMMRARPAFRRAIAQGEAA